MIKLPGLVDVHVHMREPGDEHKEDWASGTAAAVAGGITTVLAMPNTSPPVTDAVSLETTLGLASSSAVCDYGLFVGATSSNAVTAAALAPRAAGLKLYLNDTYGELRLDTIDVWADHLASWPKERPVVAHAEGQTAAAVILAAHLAQRQIHVCHISSRAEIELIANAKQAGIDVTCEVAPHHLFLTEKDIPSVGEGRAAVRPPLATEDDRTALWERLDVIDCFATDHAPHLVAEKDTAAPPPGFAGLETALPLLLDAVSKDRLTIEDIITRMHTRPIEIFNLPHDATTHVEVDPDEQWVINGSALHSKAGWSPFDGRQVRGRVSRVVLRGREIFANGEITSPPGFGRDVRAEEA